MSIQTGLRHKVVNILDTLSEDALLEVISFLDYLQYKREHQPTQKPPYKPIVLGGLWQSTDISEQDIALIRQEMWNGFGKQE